MVKLMDDLIGLGVAVPDLGFLSACMKAIKAIYRNGLLKVWESKKSGKGTEEIYKPKLP